MTAITKTLFAAVMSAGLAAAFMPASAFAQGANQGWYKTCTKQEDNDVCIVQNIVTAPTGQLLTAVGLINVTAVSCSWAADSWGNITRDRSDGGLDLIC
jgi:invasion protein IalB